MTEDEVTESTIGLLFKGVQTGNWWLIGTGMLAFLVSLAAGYIGYRKVTAQRVTAEDIATHQVTTVQDAVNVLNQPRKP